MNRLELFLVADRILADIPRDPASPHYLEETFRKKLQLAEIREPKLRIRQTDPSEAYLIQREWASILRSAGLTARQREVVTLRLEGKTFEEIGRRSGCTKQAILNILRQAGKKIGVHCDVYPYAGLTEVYRAEMKRGLRPTPAGRLLR